MLGKLMKYEFMAMGRVLLPMFGALLAVTLINRLLMLLPAQAPIVISTVVASFLIAAVFIITLILILQRFMKNLLSEEGYLMMTLPVRTDSLILSKLFVATIFVFAAVLVAVLGIFILSSQDFVYMFSQLGVTLSFVDFQGVVLFIQALMLSVFGVFASILLLYTCMSLSLLVNKRRGLFAFGAFVVITTVLQVLGTIALVTVSVSSGVPNFFEGITRGMSGFGISQLVFAGAFIFALAQNALFYFITRYMLKRRLNLQ